ncbi:MAG: DUF5666 domain-containing protein [Acidimicrobiales bacterium]
MNNNDQVCVGVNITDTVGAMGATGATGATGRHGEHRWLGGSGYGSRIGRLAIIVAVVFGAAACSSSPASSVTAKVPSSTSSPSSHKLGLSGVITALSAHGFTLTLKSSTLNIALTGSTKYKDNGVTSSYSSLANGDHVKVVLVKGASSSTAKEVAIEPPEATGKVSAVSTTGFTMTMKSGKTDNVVTNSSTVYSAAGKPAAASSLHTGERVRVIGPATSTGSISASHVTIMKRRHKKS